MPTLKPCYFRFVLLCVLYIPVHVLVIQQQYVYSSGPDFMPFILSQIDFMPFFSREHIFFYFMPISLCPPINGIKSEFMPDRHKNGRPTLSRFDMKSDRYCVGPVCVRGGFVPRDQFDMLACREWSTNAALEVVSHAMCSRTTLQGARANARPTSLHTT